MTREELDELEARASSVEPLDVPLITCPELRALIAQARRAIELEERIQASAEKYADLDGIKANGPFFSNLLIGFLQ